MLNQVQRVRDYGNPAGLQLFCQMVEDHPDIEVEVFGTKQGYEIFFKTPSSKKYVLNTQRKSIRRFKSPSTLFNFLSEIGVNSMFVNDLKLCGPDRYVNLNKSRHERRLKALTKKRGT